MPGCHHAQYYYMENTDTFRRVFCIGWLVLIPYEFIFFRLFAGLFINLVAKTLFDTCQPFTSPIENNLAKFQVVRPPWGARVFRYRPSLLTHLTGQVPPRLL